ncbi:MAG: 50S ribosomal protein L25 [Candidatus Peregrinibacteria bacterium]
MAMVPLIALARTKEKPNRLRTAGKVPCILYGNDTPATPLMCDYKDLRKAYITAGESTLVDLAIGGKSVPVLFHATDIHPVSNRITHVDFYAVDMKKEIEAHVMLHFTGEAPGVKDLGGVLVIPHDHVTVRCLPSALPHTIEVSVASLAAFGASVTVGDLKVPQGVHIQESKSTVLVLVQEPRKEEVIEAPVAAVVAEGAEAAQGEGAEAGKEEGSKVEAGKEPEKAEKSDKGKGPPAKK